MNVYSPLYLAPVNLWSLHNRASVGARKEEGKVFFKSRKTQVAKPSLFAQWRRSAILQLSYCREKLM